MNLSIRPLATPSALAVTAAAALVATPASAAVTGVTLAPGNTITSVEFDNTTTINSGDFLQPTLGDFDDGNEPQLVDAAAAGGTPTFSPNAAFLDGDIETGYANFGSLQLDFSSNPLTNDGNAVLVLVDVGFIAAVEDFTLTTDAGGTFSFVDATTDGDFDAGSIAFDLFNTNGSTSSVSDVAGLNSASFNNKVLDNTTSGRTFVAINLNEFTGLAPNATVNSITIDTGVADGSGFDLVEGFAVVVPEPGSMTLLGLGALMIFKRRSSDA
jgi:hypothetical protein